MSKTERAFVIRERIQQFEAETLSSHAALSVNSRGRARPERECDIRTAFQRDRDRILHTKAFRRLRGKTQVFLSPKGDHYRTRLTHTLETSQISRTVARALRLNEDLVEAIALAHDLGHTPFGHSGEAVLAKLNPAGFRHNEQSLRVVEILEYDGKGLNLTCEVREGILHHSKGLGKLADIREICPSLTLEGEIVRLCDCVAYANHDLDDALRAGFVKENEVPRVVREVLGDTFSRRIDTLVHDIVEVSSGKERIGFSPRVEEGLEGLRSFLVERVYESPELVDLSRRAERVLEELFGFYMAHPAAIPVTEVPRAPGIQGVCDHIAGMTDRFALNQFKRHIMPEPWGEE